MPAGNDLPPPSKPATQRQTSVSPTPRKRYTVALGVPITAPDEVSLNPATSSTDSKCERGSGGSKPTSGAEDDDDDDESGEEMISKSAAARLASSGTLGGGSIVGRGRL